MNTSATNFVKMNTNKQRFTNEVKTERKENHKNMQQARRSARSNKHFVKYL